MGWGKAILILGLLILGTVLFLGCSGNKSIIDKQDQHEEQQKSDPKTVTDYTFISSNEKENCASCHRQEKDRDFSLAAVIPKIKDHDGLNSVTLATCMGCHGKDAGFRKALHRQHLLGDNQDFFRKYNGACVDCHKLAITGDIFINEMVPKGVKLEGIKTAMVDTAPEGCPSCHKKIDDDNDRSLEAEIAKIDSHIKLYNPTIKTCNGCHNNQAGGIAFKIVIHKRHLLGEHCIEYGNSCLNCHIVTADGEIKVKGL
ncbi:MAG: multiheme c-type cytochrome [Bacillota bacterium]